MWMLVYPAHLVLLSAILSNEIFCVHFWPKIILFLCACHKNEMHFITQPMDKKLVGGKHNILVHFVNVCASDPSGVVICNPFKWDILWFILTKNLDFCVPTTLAKQILFHNHMNKNVVGGKNNVLIHYTDASAPDPEGVVCCNTFKWDILWFISDQKSSYLCAYHISKTIFFLQPHEQKACRRQKQCSSTLCGC